MINHANFMTPQAVVHVASTDDEFDGDDEEEQKKKRFHSNCVAYTVGSIVNKIKKVMQCKCDICAQSLISTDNDAPPSEATQLIKRKGGERNKLITPSGTVLKIAECCEAAFNNMVRYRTHCWDPSSDQLKLPSKRDMKVIKNSVM